MARILQAKTLYVVKTRLEHSEPARSLTTADRLAGWEPLFLGPGQDRIFQRGHDTGRLDSLTADHILTWNPEPGDTILARLRVEVLLRCESVLGRPVMLGEDTADEAFGRDAIWEQVAHAIAGDWWTSPCELKPEDLSSNDPATDYRA